MQQKQTALAQQINNVEANTNDITTTTVALKNRTEELAAKQDEILRQILALTQSQQNPLGKVTAGQGETPQPE